MCGTLCLKYLCVLCLPRMIISYLDYCSNVLRGPWVLGAGDAALNTRNKNPCYLKAYILGSRESYYMEAETEIESEG